MAEIQQVKGMLEKVGKLPGAKGVTPQAAPAAKPAPKVFVIGVGDEPEPE